MAVICVDPYTRYIVNTPTEEGECAYTNNISPLVRQYQMVRVD